MPPKKKNRHLCEQRKRMALNDTRGRNLEDTNPAEDNISHEASSTACGGATAQNVPGWASAFNLQSNDSLTNIDEAENNDFHCESDDDEAAHDTRYAYTRDRYEAQEIDRDTRKTTRDIRKQLLQNNENFQKN